jgi:hypothetical protein
MNWLLEEVLINSFGEVEENKNNKSQFIAPIPGIT